MIKPKHRYLAGLLESLETKTSFATIEASQLLDKINNKKVVVYFYAKSDIEESIIESKSFVECFNDFQTENTEILGISKESSVIQQQFKYECTFPFELISDLDGILCEVFNVKSIDDEPFKIERKTFLFNSNGHLYNEWRNVAVDGHGKQVLSMVKEIG